MLVGGTGAKSAAIRYDLEPGAPGHAYAQRGGAGTLALLEPGQQPSLIVSAARSYAEFGHAITPISMEVVADRFELMNAVVESSTTLKPLTALSSMTLRGTYGLAVLTLSFPTAGQVGSSA